MKLAANLSWLFKEEACLLKRIALAEKAGFKSIELAWPYQYTVSEFKAAVDASSVQVVLINTAPGNKEGDMGLAAVPGREEDFIIGLKQAIEYAKAASCGNIHIMAGNVASGADRAHYRYRNRIGQFQAIFEINVGKGRNRHTTNLKLNNEFLTSFKSRVVLCRIRLFPILISKIKWTLDYS